MQVELPAVDSVVETWDEARDERNGLLFSIAALGDAIWIYGTCRDRDALLLPTLATKLLEASGFAALALPSPTSREVRISGQPGSGRETSLPTPVAALQRGCVLHRTRCAWHPYG